MSQNSNDTMAKTHQAPLGRMESENWWGLCFWVCAAEGMQLPLGEDVNWNNSQCLFPLCRKGCCPQTAKLKDLSREIILWQWSVLKLGFRDLLQAQLSEEDPSPCTSYSPAHHPLWHNTTAPKDTVPEVSHSPARTQLFWGSQEFRDNKEIKFWKYLQLSHTSHSFLPFLHLDFYLII